MLDKATGRVERGLNQYQNGMCISRVLKTTERTPILQPQISSRSLLDRRRYLTMPVLGLLQLAPQPQTNETCWRVIMAVSAGISNALET